MSTESLIYRVIWEGGTLSKREAARGNSTGLDRGFRILETFSGNIEVKIKLWKGI